MKVKLPVPLSTLKTCKYLKSNRTFTSVVTGKTTTVTCKINNVVYPIQYSQCNKHHVGETENPLHIRLNGHKSDIKKPS